MSGIGLLNAIFIYISIVFAAWFLVESPLYEYLTSISGLILFALVMYNWFGPVESPDLRE
jgi:hypothetical protein